MKKSILASKAAEGKIYLTKSGVAVLVKKIRPTGVQVILEFTDKTLSLKSSTLLFVVNKKKLKKKVVEHFKKLTQETHLTPVLKKFIKAQIKHPSNRKAPSAGPRRQSQGPHKRGPKGPQAESVRSIVDPLLFEGTYTIAQMAAKLAEAPISKLLRNKDLRWYISGQMCILKKAGHLVEKLDGGIVRVTRSGPPKVIELKKELVLETEPQPVLATVRPPSSLLSRLARFGKREKTI